MITAYVLSTLLTATLGSLVYVVKKNLDLYEKLEEVSEAIEVSLDVLEVQHAVIEEKTKIEVFSDEPVVRELLNDMTIAKNSVLRVAQILDDSIKIEDIDEDGKKS